MEAACCDIQSRDIRRLVFGVRIIGKGRAQQHVPSGHHTRFTPAVRSLVVEEIAAFNDWTFERSGVDEVTILSKGAWTDYELSLPG